MHTKQLLREYYCKFSNMKCTHFWEKTPSTEWKRKVWELPGRFSQNRLYYSTLTKKLGVDSLVSLSKHLNNIKTSVTLKPLMDDIIRKSSTYQYNDTKTWGSNFLLLHMYLAFTELLKILSFIQLASLMLFWNHCQIQVSVIVGAYM